MSKQKWYEAPLIAAEAVYWKTPSEIWFWASILSFAASLAVGIFVPSEPNALYLRNVSELSRAESFIRRNLYHIVLIVFIAVFIFLYFFYKDKPRKRKKLYHKAQFIFAAGIILAVWDLLTAKSRILPIPYCPGFSEIVTVMFDDRILLLVSMAYSFRLFAAGLILGTTLGIVTGACIGWSKQWDYWLSPVIRVSGIIPAVAWLPIALMVFPNSFTTGLFLIFISSWFPVSSMAASGILATPVSYFEAAKTLGADNKFLLFKVAIPNAMPSMFTGIMTATAFSFTTLIVSEMVGAKAGLGFYINWAKGWGNYSKVYAAIIIIALEFSIIIAIINAIRSNTLRWQRGIVR
jgi:NitT/TauT family transport system permease protein